ncbi:TonB-dependent receptor [Sphingomonas parva]|uniref:TonB-dependent receptor n=1 Tax=Sphingomonas parva TaxID=2555898 RepID=A0A4Y8ZU96_9SPHN|nr:TonB-dependent receptor [Sphingomonas parva]TFI59618.1 TonB-dependent receptor [Sphingomonas parva]
MKLIFAAGASLGALVAAGHPAAAQTRAPDDEPILVTGERMVDADREVAQRPGGADLVTAEDYRDRAAVSLRDALAFSPGVYAQPRFGQEVRLSIRGSGLSRGFHMRGLTLLQDGIPINLADDNGDFQELDPAVLHHIEVYRGASGLRFGGSTLGGAINGVTPTGRSSPGVTARLDGGSFDTVRALASAGYADSRGDAWFALSADRSDGEREHAQRHSLRFHGNVGLRLTPLVETRFYASAQTIDQALPGALPLAVVRTRPKTGIFAGDQARDIESLRLQNRTTFTIGGTVVDVGAFLNAKALHHPIFQVVDQQSTDYGAYSRLAWELGPLALVTGGTARFGTVDSRRSVNLNGKRGALTFQADQEARTIDVYAEARYRIGAVSLIAGGIYTDGMRAQHQLVPTGVRARAEFGQFSPRLGLLWDPRGNLQFYANYSRSHELPGFIELAQVASFVPVEAQRAHTAEVGGRGRIGIATFDLSLYRARLRGEMLQFTVGPDIPASTFNADRTLHQGIEAALTLHLASWARLRQAYQLNDFRFRDDRQFGENRLPVIPRHLYRAELRLGGDGFHVAPTLEWVPEGPWADYANTLKLGGDALLGLTAEAALRDGLTLFLDARNLGNRKAVGDISAVVKADAAAAIFYPVERRAAFAGVRARF